MIQVHEGLAVTDFLLVSDCVHGRDFLLVSDCVQVHTFVEKLLSGTRGQGDRDCVHGRDLVAE